MTLNSKRYVRLGAVVLAVFAIGRPEHSSRAEVFINGRPLQREFGILDNLQATSGVRRLKVNGHDVKLVIGQTRSTAAQVADSLQVVSDSVVAVEPSQSPRGRNDLAELVQKAQSRPFRAGGRDWSIFGQAAGGGIAPSARFAEALHRLGVVPEDGALGRAFIVSAYDPPRPGTPTRVVLSIYPDGFDRSSLFVEPGKDVEGFDLPGISRFSGSYRTYSQEEVSSRAASRMVIYWGRGSLEEHAAHFMKSLADAGWALPAAPIQRAGQVFIVATRSGGDATYFGKVDTPSGEITDVIQVKFVGNLNR